MKQSISSPLLARVQRHAQFATIFRRPTWSSPNHLETGGAVAVTLSAPQMQVANEGDVGQHLSVLAPQFSASDGQTLNAPLPRAGSEVQIRSSLPTPAVVQPMLAPPPAPAAPVAQPGRAPIGPASPLSTSAASSDDPLDAAAWSRLQTIMRKHQEKQAAEPALEAASAPAGSADPASGQLATAQRVAAPTVSSGIQRQSIPQPSERAALPLERRRAAVTYVTDRERKPVQGVLQPSPVAAASVASTSTHAVIDPTSAASSMLQRQEQTETVNANDLTTAATSALKQSAAPLSVTVRQSPELPQPVVDEEVRGDSTSELPDEPAPVVAATDWQSQHESTSRSLANIEQTTAFALAAPLATRQLAREREVASVDSPLPLEAVWPVAHQDIARAPVNPSSVPLTSEPEPLRATARADAATVQRALQHVQTGQPTTSPVELIVPRRPRPRTSPMRQSAQPISGTAGQAEPFAPVSSEQRPPAMPDPATQLDIQTEIGPLPADLWNAIDEPAPVQLSRSAQSPAIDNLPRTDVSIDAAPTEGLPLASAQSESGHRQRIYDMAPTAISAPVERGVLSETHAGAKPLTSPTYLQPTDPAGLTQTGVAGATSLLQAPSSWESVPPRQPGLPGDPAFQAVVQRTEGEAITVYDQVQFTPRDQALPLLAKSVGNQQRAIESSIAPIAVQRQADETGAPAEPPPNPATTEGTPSKAELVANEINTDELARRVYAELKRRLTIEWERLRSR